MRKLKSICLGAGITAAFFAFAYFVSGIAPNVRDYGIAVCLMAFESALIGLVWGLNMYLNGQKQSREAK